MSTVAYYSLRQHCGINKVGTAMTAALEATRSISGGGGDVTAGQGEGRTNALAKVSTLHFSSDHGEGYPSF